MRAKDTKDGNVPVNREMKLEEMTYVELVEYVTQQVHSALLREGGEGMRKAIHLWLSQAILWNQFTKEIKRTQ